MTFSKYFINYGKSDGKAGFLGAGNPRFAWIARPPILTTSNKKTFLHSKNRERFFYYNELK